jgi:DNA-binding MarR family transcriptional regulator
MMIGIQIIGIPNIGIRMTEPDFHAMALEMRILQGVLGKIHREEIERRLTSLAVGVSAVQFFLMHTLRHEEQTLSELSRKMMLDPSTLVPMVDTLERKGYIRRGRDPRDRRRVPLSLTDEALSLIASVPTIDENDMILKALTRMGHEKALHLVELLREMVKELPNGESLIEEIGSRVKSFKGDHHCSPPKGGNQIV